MIGAYLGRDYSFDLGSFKIHPNMYTMLIGVPGTRKSTAIKLAKKLLKLTTYDKFSADKSSKEKFILDLAGESSDSTAADLLKADLWGEMDNESLYSEMYVACDEFNNFIGNGNIEFISLLGEFWDYEGIYSNRIKNGKSVSISNPTISILGGNTATGFSLAFPAQTIGQGFFSRLLLIFSEPSGRKITFPEAPDATHTKYMVDRLLAIKQSCRGTATLTPIAKSLLDKIYKTADTMDDIRFEHFANRRFTHLLKLALICSASRGAVEISEADVVYANTILFHTEQLMPKALGEFGEGRNSSVNHKIIQVLEANYRPMGLQEIWKHVGSDLDRMATLGDALGGLAGAGKILRTEGGFLAKRLKIIQRYDDVVDYSLLSEDETGPQEKAVKLTVV